MTGDCHAKSILILTEAIQNKQPSALVTVVDVKGASPVKIGALGQGTHPGHYYLV